MAKRLGVRGHSSGGVGRCFVWKVRDLGPHFGVCGRFLTNGNLNLELPNGRWLSQQSCKALGLLCQGIFLCEESSKNSCERRRSFPSFSPSFLSEFGMFPLQVLEWFSLPHTKSVCLILAKTFHQCQQRTGLYHRHPHDEWRLMFPTAGKLSLLHLKMGPAQLCSSI